MNKTSNKFLLLILMVTMAVNFSFVPLTVYAWEDEGNGTLEAPYLIKTVADLVWIEEQVNVHSNIFQNVYFALNNDIDFEGVENWMPIGRTTALQGFTSEYFGGHFDGRGNTIKNLTINRPDESYIGLFGWISGGTIENLNLIDCNITGKNYVGGLVGSINAYGAIRNCLVDGSVIGYDYVGGITGYNGNGNEIDSCHNAAKVTGNNHYTGGIVGGNVKTVVNCYNNGEVSGATSYVGGIAGTNNDPPRYSTGVVERCYNSGKVSGGYGAVGGVLGDNYGGGIVKNCYNVGDISGVSDVGGVVGSNAGATEYCYNTGIVSSTSTQETGGVIGYNFGDIGTIKNCASLGAKVSGAGSSVGRVVGNTTGTISSNYAFDGLRDINNLSTSWTNKGKNTLNGADVTKVQAQTVTFWITAGNWNTAGWDITVWDIKDGRLPILKNIGRLQVMPDISWYNTSDTEFTITTADQLAGLAQLVNDGTDDFFEKTITLTSNIDLSNYGKGWNSGKGWIPIGYSYYKYIDSDFTFKGIFDGNNKMITGIYVNEPDAYSVGLFGVVDGGTLKNLGVMGANITGSNSVGSVVGYVIGDGSVTNCYATGEINGYQFVGGIIGAIYYGYISNCYSTSVINGIFRVGGVVGCVSVGSVTNCYAIGSVSGTYDVGGVAGNVVGDSNMANCYATGAVSSSSGNVGGVVGYISGYRTKVMNCAALCPSVTGSPNIGRVLGHRLSGSLSGNVAWDNITNNAGSTVWGNKGAANYDGIDASMENAKKASFWSTIGNWDTSGWDTTIWDIADGRLPILKNVVGLQTEGIISVAPDTENNKVTVNLISPWPGGVLIVAVYENKKLLDLVQKTITQGGESNVNIYILDANEIKVMMWDRLNTMQPLSESKTIGKDDNGDWITVNFN